MSRFQFIAGFLIIALQVAVFNAIDGNFEHIVCSLLFLLLAFADFMHNESGASEQRTAFRTLHHIHDTTASLINDLPERERFIDRSRESLDELERDLSDSIRSLSAENQIASIVAILAVINLCRIFLT